MKINNPEKRLQKFTGKIDKKHIAAIAEYVVGPDVLDMGSGYGTTTAHMSSLGLNCIGIDYDMVSLERARKLFPNGNYQFANAEKLPFADNSFDTIILRDALHHFYQEADFEKIKSEILRVSKPKARIIILDPNVNFMLKTMRKISFHKDAECNFETALDIVKNMNYKIMHSSFNTLYSLPLSGGYVGVNFTPNINFIQSFIINSEYGTEKLVNKLNLGRNLCWRYLIVGEKQ